MLFKQHLFDHCLLSMYYIPGAVLGAEQNSPIPVGGETTRSKINRVSGRISVTGKKKAGRRMGR